jgi:hypothetical protein
MRDLPFDQLAGRTLKASALLLAPCVVLLIFNYATIVAWGLIIGIGTGMWNTYFLVRRYKIADPKDKFFKQKLQQNLMSGLALRLITTIVMLFVAAKISIVTAIAAAAGIFAVWGIFAAMAVGVLLKEAKTGFRFYKS